MPRKTKETDPNPKVQCHEGADREDESDKAMTCVRMTPA